MNWEKRIVRDCKIFGGKPTVKGTRISVELIMTELGWGLSDADIIEWHYPYLAVEDIAACREYVAAGEPMTCITNPEIDALLAAGNDDGCPILAAPGTGWVGRVVNTPNVLRGRPRVNGTRLSVELIMKEVKAGYSDAEIMAGYPRLTVEDIAACREFAATGELLTYNTEEESEAFWDAYEYTERLKRQGKIEGSAYSG